MKSKQFEQQMDVGGGLETRLADSLVEGLRCIGVLDFEFSSRPGHAVTRRGTIPWASCNGSGTMHQLRKFYSSDQTKGDYMLAQAGKELYRAPTGSGAFVKVWSGLADAYADSAQFDDWAIFGNGVDCLRSSDGFAWIPVGNVPPSQPPSIASLAGGSASGNYLAGYSLVYGPGGEMGESPISPYSPFVTLANARIRLSNLAVGTPGVSSRRIYVSSHSSPGTVYLLDSAPGNTIPSWSSPAFTEDDLGESAMVGLAETPATAMLLKYHGGRLFFVRSTERSVLSMTLPFSPEVGGAEGGPGITDSRDDINDVRDNDGARITALASTGGVLLVWTETALWALYGQDRETMRLERIFEVGLPEGAFRTVQVINGQAYWKSYRHVYATNGFREGTRNISLGIERTIDTIGMTAANVEDWCAVDYRRRNWYMLFISAGNQGLYGSLDQFRSADLSITSGPPGTLKLSGGAGFWNSAIATAEGRLCLVYDYVRSATEGRSIWTIFSIPANIATCPMGPGDTGVMHFADGIPKDGVIHRFERADGVHGDGTADLQAKIVMAWRGSGLEWNDKRVRKLYLMARELDAPTTQYFGLAADFAGSIWTDSLPWSTVGDVQRLFQPEEMVSEHFAVYCGHSGASTRFALEGFGLDFKPWQRR